MNCNSKAVKLSWIFPGAPLSFNGASGNIQGMQLSGHYCFIIVWTRDDFLSVKPWGINFSEIWIMLQQFPLKKTYMAAVLCTTRVFDWTEMEVPSFCDGSFVSMHFNHSSAKTKYIWITTHVRVNPTDISSHDQVTVVSSSDPLFKTYEILSDIPMHNSSRANKCKICHGTIVLA